MKRGLARSKTMRVIRAAPMEARSGCGTALDHVMPPSEEVRRKPSQSPSPACRPPSPGFGRVGRVEGDRTSPVGVISARGKLAIGEHLKAGSAVCRAVDATHVALDEEEVWVMRGDDGSELGPAPTDTHDLPGGRSGICGSRDQEEKKGFAPIRWLQPRPQMA